MQALVRVFGAQTAAGKGCTTGGVLHTQQRQPLPPCTTAAAYCLQRFARDQQAADGCRHCSNVAQLVVKSLCGRSVQLRSSAVVHQVPAEAEPAQHPRQEHRKHGALRPRGRVRSLLFFIPSWRCCST